MSELHSLLQAIGSWGSQHEFVRRGRTRVFARTLREVLWLIEVQKSRTAQAQVTINLGVYLPTVANREGTATESPETPDCQWWARLGELGPAADDVWWSIGSPRATRASAEEICALLDSVGLPAFRARSSLRALIALWEGGDCGLTEVQRRRWLEAAKRQLGSGPHAGG